MPLALLAITSGSCPFFAILITLKRFACSPVTERVLRTVAYAAKAHKKPAAPIARRSGGNRRRRDRARDRSRRAAAKRRHPPLVRANLLDGACPLGRKPEEMAAAR